MIRRIRFAYSLVLSLASIGLLSAAAEAKAPRPPKIKTVLVTEEGPAEFLNVLLGHRDIAPVVERANPVLGKQANVFESIDHWAYDTIVIYTLAPDLAPEHRENFLKLMDRGVGLVIVHHSLAAFQQWPEFKQIAGGKFYTAKTTENGVERPPSGASHDQDYTVRVADPQHPIAKGLKDFAVRDETFANVACLPGNHVFLTIDHPASDKPAGWTHTYRKSRVCTIAPGHGPAIFNQPQYRHLVAQAIRWAAGRPTLSLEESQVQPVELALQDILSYEHGQTRWAAVVLEKLAGQSAGNPAARKDLIARLVRLLDSPDATIACKEFVSKQLMRIGGPEVVPALAKLIGEEENVAYLGRYALQQIPDPAAAAALREALGRTKGRVLVGVIQSLGARRDPEAVAPLVPLVSHADAAVAASAAWSLGKIGGPEAVRALWDAWTKTAGPARAAIADALLTAADRSLADGKKDRAAAIYEPLLAATEPPAVRIAALRGIVAVEREKAVPRIVGLMAGPDKAMFCFAVEHVRRIPGNAATAVFAAHLAKLPDADKPLLIEALADRGDTGARPAILNAYASKDAEIHVAVLKALGRLGTAADAPLLIRAATTGSTPALRDAALRSLIALRDPAVDAAVLARLERAEGEGEMVLLRALALRRAPTALSELLKAAEDENQAVCTEALALLQRIVGDKDVPALVKVLAAAQPGRAREAAERALWASCLAIAEPDKRVEPLLAVLEKGDVSTRAAILPVAGRLGGPKALEVIHAAMKDPDEPIRDAAVQGLANWPDAGVAAELMQIAKTAPKPAQRLAALRAFARVVAKPSTRPPQETFAMLKEALTLAQRAEDRQYVLSRFSGARTPEALALVVSHLDDPAVQAGAAAAAVGLADRLKQSHRDQARAALEKVLQATRDDNLRAKASELLRRMK